MKKGRRDPIKIQQQLFIISPVGLKLCAEKEKRCGGNGRSGGGGGRGGGGIGGKGRRTIGILDS